MSCTLVLVPITIGPQLVTALITSLTLSAAATAVNHKNFIEDTKNSQDIYDRAFIEKAMNQKFEQQQKICSQYKTIFKDANLLKKTLTEHEVKNIAEENGKIYGNLDSLKFEFEKDAEGLYNMYITHNENDDLSFVKELNDEYQMNVQERSYMNIKNNLEKQNLKISEEEVLEDNSILLTVNLE